MNIKSLFHDIIHEKRFFRYYYNDQKIIDIYDQIPLGKDYRPAITIQDISSLGRSHRIYNIKIGRQHDFLSDRERDYFYILYFLDSIVDIREQFPLHLGTTLLIAKEVGVPHIFSKVLMNKLKISAILSTYTFKNTNKIWAKNTCFIHILFNNT